MTGFEAFILAYATSLSMGLMVILGLVLTLAGAGRRKANPVIENFVTAYLISMGLIHFATNGFIQLIDRDSINIILDAGEKAVPLVSHLGVSHLSLAFLCFIAIPGPTYARVTALVTVGFFLILEGAILIILESGDGFAEVWPLADSFVGIFAGTLAFALAGFDWVNRTDNLPSVGPSSPRRSISAHR